MVTVQEILSEEQSSIRVAAFAGNIAAASPGQTIDRRAFCLKAAAVSVASAIRYGSATTRLITSFLQDDIPGLKGGGPLTDISAIGPEQGLAGILKTGSALALIQAAGGLMKEDVAAASKGALEYIALRRYAEKVNLAPVIIPPPQEGVGIDPDMRRVSIELHRMIVLNSIDDSLERWMKMVSFIKRDGPLGVSAVAEIREQRDRAWR